MLSNHLQFRSILSPSSKVLLQWNFSTNFAVPLDPPMNHWLFCIQKETRLCADFRLDFRNMSGQTFCLSCLRYLRWNVKCPSYEDMQCAEIYRDYDNFQPSDSMKNKRIHGKFVRKLKTVAKIIIHKK